MFYAVRLCGNPTHMRYMRPIEFITEEIDDNEVPLERATKQEIIDELKDWSLYVAGWIIIIEIEE